MLSRLLGVGIDIVEISRIQAVASRRSYGKLACRILSDTEMQDWHSLTDPYRRDEFLTVRWAIKEAAYKALYPTFRPSWKHLSFRPSSGEHSKPSLMLTHPNASPAPTPVTLHASVSHDGGFVVAYVLAETAPNNCK